MGGVVKNEVPIENNVAFNAIQNNILQLLDQAKVSIIVAVAWFTNQTLADKLIEKYKNGVSVEVVIYNDGTNAKHGVDLNEIPVYQVRAEKGGIMHVKFCVIDNQIVGSGSYNWSTNAETRNDESFQISKDPALATEHSIQFNKLKKQ